MRFIASAYLLAFATAESVVFVDDANQKTEGEVWVSGDNIQIMGTLTDKLTDRGVKDSYSQTWMVLPSMEDIANDLMEGAMDALAAGEELEEDDVKVETYMDMIACILIPQMNYKMVQKSCSLPGQELGDLKE